jgi:hypothetical protein
MVAADGHLGHGASTDIVCCYCVAVTHVFARKVS